MSYKQPEQQAIGNTGAVGTVRQLVSNTLPPSGTAGGDLSGTYPDPTVARINGSTLGTTTPTTGHLLIADGSQWNTEAMSGDATIINTGVLTLSSVNTNVGTWGDGTHVATFTVDAKGRITAASNTAITGAPPSGSAGGDLSGSYPNPTVSKINTVALGTTTATSGHLLVADGSAWQSVAMSGDATFGSTGAITFATVNSNVGSYGDATHVAAVTVNAKGLVTAASSVAITGTTPGGSASGDLSGAYPGPTVAKINGATLGTTTATNAHLLIADGSAWQSVAASGDATFANTGALTLSTVNSNVGSFTNANITVDAKGRITAASSGTGGTVTNFSFTNGSGTTGSVSNPTTTPNLSLTYTTQSSTDNTTNVATTAFVQTVVANAIAGVNPAVAVQAATTSAANTSGLSYNNGASGIGATFTGSVNTAITWDGYTFTALGQRGLVKNDTQSPSGAFNGVYYVTQIQTSLLPPILTRALDYDQPSDINNTGAIPVVNGTVNGSTTWVLTSTVSTVGTDPLTYAQFSLNPSTIITTSTSAGGDLTGTYPNPTIKNSVSLGGSPTTTTQSQGDNSTKIATTAYVDTGLSGKQTTTLTSGNILVGNGSNLAASVAMSGDVTIGNTGVTAIGSNKVTNGMLRQGAGLSVIGVTGSSTANEADIVGTASTVLGVNAAGTSLAFGQVTNAMLAGSIDLTSKVTGILPYANGGTGANSFSQHGVVTAGASALGTVAPGTSGNVLTSNGTDWVSQAPSAGSGTVTSVTFTGDGTVLSSTPSTAVTTSGTLTATLNTQTANKIFAGPASGGAVAPTFRTMVAADIPSSIVSNAKLANMAVNTIKSNITSSAAAPSDNLIGTINAHSGAYTVTNSDYGDIVSFTGSSDATWAFTAVATLASGWWCYLKNDGTSNATILLDPNASEQIDGRTSYKMYPGELRIVTCDGSKLTTQVLKPFNFTTTASITFTPPPGYTGYRFLLVGGGGAGASRATTGNASGGGGGCCFDTIIPAYTMATTGETLTIAGTTTGQSGNSNGTNGNPTTITTSVSGTYTATWTALGGLGGVNAGVSSAANAGKGGYPSVPTDFSSVATTLYPYYGWQSSGITSPASCYYSGSGGAVTSGNTTSQGGSSTYGGAGGGAATSGAGGPSNGGAAFLLGTTGGIGGSAAGGAPGSSGLGCGGAGAVNGATSGTGGAGQCQIIGVC